MYRSGISTLTIHEDDTPTEKLTKYATLKLWNQWHMVKEGLATWQALGYTTPDGYIPAWVMDVAQLIRNEITSQENYLRSQRG